MTGHLSKMQHFHFLIFANDLPLILLPNSPTLALTKFPRRKIKGNWLARRCEQVYIWNSETGLQKMIIKQQQKNVQRVVFPTEAGLFTSTTKSKAPQLVEHNEIITLGECQSVRIGHDLTFYAMNTNQQIVVVNKPSCIAFSREPWASKVRQWNRARRKFAAFVANSLEVYTFCWTQRIHRLLKSCDHLPIYLWVQKAMRFEKNTKHMTVISSSFSKCV